ncbi:hypothetical protein [Glycomyces artemisiae]|nr:hypothetical protein [Glycomyces artemisiae]
MSGPENPMPDGYPDAEALGWLRTADIEYLGVHIRMTIKPNDRIVELWELDGGRPARWLGNVFRIDAALPGLYLNHKFEAVLKSRTQRDGLAHIAAKFWKS